MKTSTKILIICGLGFATATLPGQVPAGFAGPIGAAAIEPTEISSPAVSGAQDKDARTRAMLAEICNAADRIAEKYGNLPYCHIITNDVARASALRERIMTFGAVSRLKREQQTLEERNQQVSVRLAEAEARLTAVQGDLAVQEEALRQAQVLFQRARAEGSDKPALPKSKK